MNSTFNTWTKRLKARFYSCANLWLPSSMRPEYSCYHRHDPCWMLLPFPHSHMTNSPPFIMQQISLLWFPISGKKTPPWSSHSNVSPSPASLCSTFQSFCLHYVSQWYLFQHLQIKDLHTNRVNKLFPKKICTVSMTGKCVCTFMFVSVRARPCSCTFFLVCLVSSHLSSSK